MKSHVFQHWNLLSAKNLFTGSAASEVAVSWRMMCFCSQRFWFFRMTSLW